MSEVLPREATGSQPQDLFVELFAQAFGVDKVQLLSPEHPVRDIDGTMRYVDFALRTATERFAFEIDGLAWHHPECITIAKFEDDLLRQNSLIHAHWRVYRWTDRQVAEEGERVKEQLALFLGSIPGLLAFDDFLPKQRGEVVRLELIIGEAHHASADTYRGILAHFDADFILGLTATPERADGQSVLDIFRDSAHRLTLEEAVQLGELVPIRCFRAETSIDLRRVRFNPVQYNRRDLEERIQVPARDRLIVQTYCEHVPGRKAVAFCVNVRHGEELARLFREQGVTAESVSGRTPEAQRQTVLSRFEQGEIQVLCACDILNEGWDCPSIEALTPVDDTTIIHLFLDYCRAMEMDREMSASYKPVLLPAILDTVDDRGKAPVDQVVARFRKFYEDRSRAGLPAEKPNVRMAKVVDLDDAAFRRVMLGMPFEKFERRRYLKYERDVANLRIAANLWKQLRKEDLADLRGICEESIAKYYGRV